MDPREELKMLRRQAELEAKAGGQAAPAQTNPDDPGVMQSALIGAGRAADRLVKGAQQLYYGATGNDAAQVDLKSQAAEDDRLYKPLQDAHPMATAVGESLPSMAVPVGGGATLAGNLARLAAAGGAPGALEYGTASERAGRAAIGAGAGVVGGVVAPKIAGAVANTVANAVGLPAIGRTAKAVVEPLYEGGRQQIAGRSLNAVAGQDGQAIARMAGAAPVVPGSIPTAAQVAENGGIAALERSLASRNPADFTQRSMEQSAARTQALRGIAGDDATLANAVKYRGDAAEKGYRNAFAAGVDQDMAAAMKPQIEALMGRPSVIKATKKAQDLAREDSLNLTDMGSVQGLHYMKMALDDIVAESASNPTKQRLVSQTARDMQSVLEQIAPEYKSAVERYARNSVPINRMEVGRELLQRIQPALADHGALASETGSNYAHALRNAEQTAKRATGLDGATLNSVMAPQQMQIIEGVAQDLARKANSQNLGRGPGSNTFQNLAMDNIAGQSGAPRVLGAAMNLPGVSKVSKFLYSGPEEKIQTLLAQSLLDPKTAARLMQENINTRTPKTIQQMLMENPSRAAQLAGGGGGVALGNLFSQ